MKNALLFSLILLLSISCTEQKPDYKNENLSLIPTDQIVTRTKDGNFDYSKAVVKNQRGSALNKKEQKLLNKGQLGKDYYEDANGVIQEVIVRPVSLQDKLVDIQRREIMANPLQGIQKVEINCDSLDTILKEVDRSHQEVRKTRGDIAGEDTKNLSVVVSSIAQCGWSEGNMRSIWMVLNNAPLGVLAYYYEDLFTFARKKNLSPSSVAMLQDRLLMEHGYKQVYGTQIISGQLYKLEDPANVNKRRAEVGMDKLENFLKIWKLDLNTELERIKKEEQNYSFE